MPNIAVGDEVRVHFHPPGPVTSFSEGVVRRVDVTTPEGRFFVLEVRHEVILDREHRIRPAFQDYIRYEGRNDFPGRIEVLSAEQDAMDIPAPNPIIEFNPPKDLDDRTREPEAESEPPPVHLERQEARQHGGRIAALLRWQR